MDVPEFDSFTLREFIDALARKEPAPGGGCAAATAGAMAAGLVAMVARVAAEKAKDQTARSDLIRMADEMDGIRSRLTDLISLDAKAYRNLKSAQGADVLLSWKEAVQVPFDIAAQSLAVLNASVAAAQWSPYHTLSDVVAASALAFAGVEGGVSTVAINVSFAPSGADGEVFQAKASEMLFQARNLKYNLEAILSERFDKSQ